MPKRLTQTARNPNAAAPTASQPFDDMKQTRAGATLSVSTTV